MSFLSGQRLYPFVTFLLQKEGMYRKWFPKRLDKLGLHLCLSPIIRRDAPGAVRDLNAGALALPAATPGGRAVTGAGATEAGSHGAAVGVRAGCPRWPRAEVPVHGEIPRLGSRCAQGCQKGLSANDLSIKPWQGGLL